MAHGRIPFVAYGRKEERFILHSQINVPFCLLDYGVEEVAVWTTYKYFAFWPNLPPREGARNTKFNKGPRIMGDVNTLISDAVWHAACITQRLIARQP